IAQLVDTATLHSRAGPHLADSAPKPCIAVDNGEHWRLQAACDEIVQAAFPRRERLTMAQLQGEQALSPIGEDPDDAQHRHADHPSCTAYAQSEAIEVHVNHVEFGERAGPPCLWRRLALIRGSAPLT